MHNSVGPLAALHPATSGITQVPSRSPWKLIASVPFAENISGDWFYLSPVIINDALIHHANPVQPTVNDK